MSVLQMTDEMALALHLLREHGSLVKHEGSIWSYPDVKVKRGRPEWCCNIATIHALLRRGLAMLSDDGKIAIEAYNDAPKKALLLTDEELSSIAACLSAARFAVPSGMHAAISTALVDAKPVVQPTKNDTSWQTMDRAPRDGSPIMVAERGDWEAIRVWWDQQRKQWCGYRGVRFSDEDLASCVYVPAPAENLP